MRVVSSSVEAALDNLDEEAFLRGLAEQRVRAQCQYSVSDLDSISQRTHVESAGSMGDGVAERETCPVEICFSRQVVPNGSGVIYSAGTDGLSHCKRDNI